MPPKKGGGKKGGGGGGGKKDVKKVVADKTFGMKNKKGKKNQQIVKQIQRSCEASMDQGPTRRELKKKEEAEARRVAEMLGGAQAGVIQKKVPVGADPKSIVCEFYRAGKCTKGHKCKFSHNIEVERKGPKIDLYSDRRDEGMEDWDEDTLREAVDKKDKRRPNQTDIVCKYFIKAIEDKKYGWFWECPNGDGCIYRHRLPPGFVLKSEQKKADEGPVISIEEIIETERAKLSGGTPVTLESFNEWKVKSRERKEAQKKKEEDEKKDKASNQRDKERFMSGKALFEFKPDIFVDDDNADDTGYVRPDSDDEDAGAGANGEKGVVVDEGAFAAEVGALDLDDDDL